MNNINSTCECGYDFYFFCTEDDLEEYIECPICGAEYRVKRWIKER